MNSKAWTNLNPSDSIKQAPVLFSSYRVNLGDELIAGGSFDSGLQKWSSYFSSSGRGGNSQLANGLAGCDQQCAVFTSGIVGDRLSTPQFRMKAGSQYYISYVASFGGQATISHPNIARPVTPYESYVDPAGLSTGNTTLSGAKGESLKYEAFFVSTSNDDAIAHFRIETVGVPVAFDSVSLRPVIGYTISHLSDYSAVVSQSAGASKVLGCSDLGWAASCSVVDIDGTSVAMPVTLNAGSTRFLLWANSPWRRKG